MNENDLKNSVIDIGAVSRVCALHGGGIRDVRKSRAHIPYEAGALKKRTIIPRKV